MVRFGHALEMAHPRRLLTVGAAVIMWLATVGAAIAEIARLVMGR